MSSQLLPNNEITRTRRGRTVKRRTKSRVVVAVVTAPNPYALPPNAPTTVFELVVPARACYCRPRRFENMATSVPIRIRALRLLTRVCASIRKHERIREQNSSAVRSRVRPVAAAAAAAEAEAEVSCYAAASVCLWKSHRFAAAASTADIIRFEPRLNAFARRLTLIIDPRPAPRPFFFADTHIHTNMYLYNYIRHSIFAYTLTQ